jgi:hypothetical protein
VPVTARLSRKFYERFGDEITNELVEWFNQVDQTYRTELREINEINYARFEATLGRFEATLEQKLANLRADLIKWMFLFWATTALGVIGLLKF